MNTAIEDQVLDKLSWSDDDIVAISVLTNYEISRRHMYNSTAQAILQVFESTPITVLRPFLTLDGTLMKPPDEFNPLLELSPK